MVLFPSHHDSFNQMLDNASLRFSFHIHFHFYQFITPPPPYKTRVKSHGSSCGPYEQMWSLESRFSTKSTPCSFHTCWNTCCVCVFCCYSSISQNKNRQCSVSQSSTVVTELRGELHQQLNRLDKSPQHTDDLFEDINPLGAGLCFGFF